jgi:hypothetical protein
LYSYELKISRFLKKLISPKHLRNDTIYESGTSPCLDYDKPSPHFNHTQFFKIISILLPRTQLSFPSVLCAPFPSVFLTGTLYVFLLCLSLSLARALHFVHLIFPLLAHPNSIWRSFQITMLDSMQFSQLILFFPIKSPPHSTFFSSVIYQVSHAHEVGKIIILLASP